MTAQNPNLAAMSAANALAVYVLSTKIASLRAASRCASREASLGTP